MLPRRKRASAYSVGYALSHGRAYHGQCFTLRATPAVTTRASFVVPKRVARTATLRNKLRRRGYAALRNHVGRLPTPHTLVFFFKQCGTTLSTRHLEKEVITLLDNISRGEYNN